MDHTLKNDFKSKEAVIDLISIQIMTTVVGLQNGICLVNETVWRSIPGFEICSVIRDGESILGILLIQITRNSLIT